MRPCTLLKLNERLMKYAGLLDEQPMPLIFITRSGSTPISYMASTIRSEMALWPQPAHSVDLPPRYSTMGRPMRLIFGVGTAVANLQALLCDEFLSDGARIERQP